MYFGFSFLVIIDVDLGGHFRFFLIIALAGNLLDKKICGYFS
jgi:hypothetical protein